MTMSREALLSSYDSVDEFEDGVACASQGEDWFHVGKDGAPLYGERYIAIDQFHHGRALVGLVGPDGNNRWFHICPDGSLAYKENYAWAGSFRGRDPTAIIVHDGDRFEIRPDGSRVE